MKPAFLKKPPSLRDVFLLCLFTVFITYQPFILYEEIVPWELGIYLPSIQATLNGLIPYRDFFYLRGPLEIYVPTLFMKLFGQSIPVLYYFFYIGTVLSFLILIFLTRYLFKIRLIFYLFSIVVVARAFPYVYYFIWGGMRYVFGLLGLLLLSYYLKHLIAGQDSNKKKGVWLIYGVAFSSSAAFLTALDVGAASILGTIFGLFLGKLFKTLSTKELADSLKHYILGLSIFLGIYAAYLLSTESFGAYFQNTFSVAAHMTKIFDTPQNNRYPASIGEWLMCLIPSSPHFKHITPLYCYILFFSYSYYLYSKKQLDKFFSVYFCVAGYGIFLYVAAWRIIENAHFEMALMVEKIFLFFLLERFLFFLKDKETLASQTTKTKRFLFTYGTQLFCIILICSSVVFAINRFNKRFDAYKVVKNMLLKKEISVFEPHPEIVKKRLDLVRMKGMMVSVSDAEEYEQMNAFIDQNTRPDEKIVFFPDHGMFNFIFDRPFLGRFAVPKFTWFDDRWYLEFMQDLEVQRPRTVFVQHPVPESWKKVALANQNNADKFNDMLNYIQNHYHVVQQTKGFLIYQIN